MKRLSRLKLHNFQAHRDTELDLSSDITVLMGPNDSGKSCVWRALYWVATNRPTGSGLQSTWCGHTRVDVELADGTVVSRIKDGRMNSYRIGKHEYKSFGTDVPAAVTQTLGWDPSINFQAQDDGPFLLSLSPAARAESLSALYGIADADRIMANLESTRRSLAAEIRTQRAILETDEPEWESRHTGLQDSKSGLEATRAVYQALESEEDELGALRAEIASLKRYAGQVSVLESAHGPLAEALELWGPVSREAKGVDRLDSWVREARQAEQRIGECGERIPAIQAAIRVWSEYRQAALEIENLQVMVGRGREAHERERECQAGIEDLRAEIQSMGLSVCPTCGQPVESADAFLTGRLDTRDERMS